MTTPSPTPPLAAAEVAAAAGLQQRDLLAVLDRVGLEPAVAFLVHDLTARCDTPDNPDAARIGLAVEHSGHRTERVLAVRKGEPVRVDEETAGPPPVRLTFDLADLVRGVYGPPPGPGAGLFRVERDDAWFVKNADDAEPFRIFESYMRAVDVLVRAATSRPGDLGRLAARHASDKWGLWHWFTPLYEHHFARLRHQPVRVLELGIGGYQNPDEGGGSLKMWRSYFPQGRIFGVDYFPKHGLDEDRIHTLQGSQDDAGFLRRVAEEHGPFDIVIDDGSHVAGHQQTAFRTLFPAVRNGGFYVIEDLWTAYCPGYGGAATARAEGRTSIGLLKSLLDDLHYEEWTAPEPAAPGFAAPSLVGVHVYRNLAVLEKGRNSEGTIPFFAPREIDYV
uniref:8-demethyl-8-(2-methoxy-alpha-L-rhamnosyl)-tetracenomycin-C 3'-O-methyltransferase n=1 Tax=Streptomyces olivaceus TaxID=47716 RepID=ELMM2_STROV|nr:RecName: Full=8-demethyl-8-(2-methoxy-alpha-L-rhamnosyl)-tetracenomycin-C 3'-O-methyltransferase; AltName: Full=O-methyltransferase II [Streptomyces olivaceus]CAD57140.1 O-methyltransferase II [Streptomyces olivaceus]CAP12608.1 rhamnose C3'-methyltransferase [Streptomyces olivaceus]